MKLKVTLSRIEWDRGIDDDEDTTTILPDQYETIVEADNHRAAVDRALSEATDEHGFCIIDARDHVVMWGQEHPLIEAFSYTTRTPAGYTCSKCAGTGRKLWRHYQTFRPRLFCAACALTEEGINAKLDKDGFYKSPAGCTDQIGSLVPAVPTEDGKAFWGYTSAPVAGAVWWQALPTYGTERG